MKEQNTYLSSASVKKQGRTAYYKMLESAKQGELIQVRRGVYANIDQLSGNMIDINAVVPEGILCLWSAWSIHQLTTSMELLNIGVISMVIDSFIIRLYDVERCVCDAIKFRNKVGMDVCSEIINNYLERPDRNLSKLMDYARKLRVGKILEQYLQVKL